MGGVHYDKAAGGRINNKIFGLSDGADQPLDQAGRLRMRVNPAINFLNPTIWNAVISPCGFGADRGLL